MFSPDSLVKAKNAARAAVLAMARQYLVEALVAVDNNELGRARLYTHDALDTLVQADKMLS